MCDTYTEHNHFTKMYRHLLLIPLWTTHGETEEQTEQQNNVNLFFHSFWGERT